MPHPPVPPARLARGGPVRVAQGLHGASLPLPPRPRPLRRRWHGRPGVTAAWRLCAAPSAAGASAPASRAGCTFAGSYGGKGEGKGKVRHKVHRVVAQSPPSGGTKSTAWWHKAHRVVAQSPPSGGTKSTAWWHKAHQVVVQSPLSGGTKLRGTSM